MKITRKSYLFKIARVRLGRRERYIPVTKRLREVKDETILGLSDLNPNSKKGFQKMLAAVRQRGVGCYCRERFVCEVSQERGSEEV